MVSDNGPGFPAELRQRAFERFVKGEHSTGHGLGLAFVAAAVQAHGGSAEVQRSSGGGAEIVLRLPAGGSAQQKGVMGEDKKTVVVATDGRGLLRANGLELCRVACSHAVFADARTRIRADVQPRLLCSPSDVSHVSAGEAGRPNGLRLQRSGLPVFRVQPSAHSRVRLIHRRYEVRAAQ